MDAAARMDGGNGSDAAASAVSPVPLDRCHSLFPVQMEKRPCFFDHDPGLIDPDEGTVSMVMVEGKKWYSVKWKKYTSPTSMFLTLPQRRASTQHCVCVLDLDHTMIHARKKSEWDEEGFTAEHMAQLGLRTIHVSRTSPDGQVRHDEMLISIRPGLQKFIRTLRTVGFKLVMYTAGARAYANSVLSLLDPEKKLVSMVFDRDSCTSTGNKWVDLISMHCHISKNRMLILDDRRSVWRPDEQTRDLRTACGEACVLQVPPYEFSKDPLQAESPAVLRMITETCRDFAAYVAETPLSSSFKVDPLVKNPIQEWSRRAFSGCVIFVDLASLKENDQRAFAVDGWLDAARLGYRLTTTFGAVETTHVVTSRPQKEIQSHVCKVQPAWKPLIVTPAWFALQTLLKTRAPSTTTQLVSAAESLVALGDGSNKQ